MDEKEKRQRRCCFTGHRPEKLLVTEQELRAKLKAAIKEAIPDGYCTFISGMSRGTDLWASDVVLQLKSHYPHIHLICAVPYPDFEKSWDEHWQILYHNILSRADLVRIISSHYHDGCYQKRNCWMVDHSSRVIAVYNGSSGGTQNTIRYAQKCAVSIVMCYPWDQYRTVRS